MPCCACTGCGDAEAINGASTTGHAINHRKQDLFLNRMKYRRCPGMGGPLRLAEGGKPSQIVQGESIQILARGAYGKTIVIPSAASQ